MSADVRAIEAALAMGPTPGEWFVDQDDRPGMEWNRSINSGPNTTVCFMAHSNGADDRRDEATAALIAACSPDVMRRLLDERREILEALMFYATGSHFARSAPDAWETVSGEPQSYWCDEAGTATVEDGAIARAALAKAEGGEHA
jgi:hypothetical protein